VAAPDYFFSSQNTLVTDRRTKLLLSIPRYSNPSIAASRGKIDKEHDNY